MSNTTPNPTQLVTLGGREYVLKPLPLRPAREWRAQFSRLAEMVISAMRHATTAQLSSPDDLASLAAEVAPKLLGLVDELIEMMFAYSPELRAERDWLEENATEEEAMAVVIRITAIAFPFGGVVPTLRQIGRGVSGMKSNSTPTSG